MTDERLRRRERESANDPEARLRLAADLYRSGRPFAEVMRRTSGVILAEMNSESNPYPKYVPARDKLVERFLSRAVQTRTRHERMRSHALDTTYARLGRVDDVINGLDDISGIDDAFSFRGRAAIKEFGRNDDFKSITEMLDIGGTPDDHCQEAVCQYLARGREKEAYAVRDREEIEVDVRELNTALARYHSTQGRYDTASTLLETAGVHDTTRAEFLARAAALRRDYEVARTLAKKIPCALEAAAKMAARNQDYDEAFAFAEQADFRSAGAHISIITEAAKNHDYDVAREAMRGALVLGGQSHHAYWKTAVRNGDFAIAQTYAPRKIKAHDREDLAIGNLRAGNLTEAQKLARTASQPSHTYCNLALALLGKALLDEDDD